MVMALAPTTEISIQIIARKLFFSSAGGTGVALGPPYGTLIGGGTDICEPFAQAFSEMRRVVKLVFGQAAVTRRHLCATTMVHLALFHDMSEHE